MTRRIRTRPLWAAAAFAAAVGLAPLAASAADMSPELQKVIDGAKKEGALHLSYASNIMGGADGAPRRGRGHQGEVRRVARHHVLRRARPSRQMASKLYTENAGRSRRPRPTSITARRCRCRPICRAGCGARSTGPSSIPSASPPEIAEADGRALRVETSLSGVLYNKKTAPEFGKMVMTDDLLKPRIQGQGLHHALPRRVRRAGRRQRVGVRKDRRVRHEAVGPGGRADAVRRDRPHRLGRGAGARHRLQRQRAEHRRSTETSWPTWSSTTRRRGATTISAIPENAEHPNAATLFGLYVSSPEGQKKIMASPVRRRSRHLSRNPVACRGRVAR